MYAVEQLHSGDYEQAIDFINMVFSMEAGPTNFPVMLPAYYKPDEAHMNCHYAIREHGQIRAMLGIYPGEVQLAGSTLHVARLGAVSTHPSHQGKGMMRTLMEFSNQLILRQNYDLAVLGGLRHRYLRFGYEKCGTKLSFSIHTGSLRKRSPADHTLWLEPYAGNDVAVVNRIKQIHDAQPMHAVRDSEQFLAYCKNWGGQLYVAWMGTQIAGYLVSNEAGTRVYEIVADEDQAAADMIAAFAAVNQNEFIHVEVPLLNPPLLQQLGELCEEVIVRPANSWQVLDWEKVIGSLMRTKNQSTELLPGQIVIGISGYGNVQVAVGAGQVRTGRTEQQADLVLNESAMMRFLFGPVPPQFGTGSAQRVINEGSGQSGLIEAADKIALLQSWCPLPLYLGIPDTA